MTYEQLVELLKAYAIVFPHYGPQKVYNLRIDDLGNLIVTLEASELAIPLAKA